MKRYWVPLEFQWGSIPNWQWAASSWNPPPQVQLKEAFAITIFNQTESIFAKRLISSQYVWHFALFNNEWNCCPHPVVKFSNHQTLLRSTACWLYFQADGQLSRLASHSIMACFVRVRGQVNNHWNPDEITIKLRASGPWAEWLPTCLLLIFSFYILTDIASTINQVII